MKDLQNAKWIWLKAWLFVGIGVTAAALLILEHPTFRTGLYLVLAIWAFCRAYYFAFYVIEHCLDPGYRYAGLWDFVKSRICRRPSNREFPHHFEKPRGGS